MLLFFAASDNFFFYTLNMTHDSAVEERDDGYELYFYTYGTEEVPNQNFFIVATLFYSINQAGENMAHITFQMSPIERFKVYSMNLDVKGFRPASALILENPESGQPPPFVYTRTDNDSSVTLDFPGLNLDYGEPFTIDFWLDLRGIELVTEDNVILDFSFSMHDESVFKIVKYVGNLAIETDIPFVVQ